MARTSSEKRRRGALAFALLIAIVSLAGTADAEVRVLACEPVWASLAREIGGDRVHVDSATTPRQDPHTIQARPSLITRTRRADLLVCTGADLEVGWLPVLLRQAGNGRVQPGRPGHLDVSKHVPMRDVPTRLDRALGDLHPQGNPHVAMDPRNITRAAAELARRLAQIDPAGADVYAARERAFRTRWEVAIRGWEERAAPLSGLRVVTHHVSWVYLASWLGLVEVAQLESKPGIPPSPARLAELLDLAQQDPPRAILRLAYEPERPSRWLSERTGIPAVVLPQAPGSLPGVDDLFDVFDEIVRQLLEVAR